ncbi:MAG: Unknown protein [uncultured Sulfurovum sp.]|uniref:Periplasmic protein related to spheroblast formation n=1 Tax=uncultured Sulfurovum sp. TaxID=269237 RepID=A0A6S6UA32_9BACT|nr:MAG: Unknown protein [uncultured Sulfurovum sp.]
MKVLKTLAVVTISGIMATTAVSAENMKRDCNTSKCDRVAKYDRGGKYHRGGKHQMKVALKAADITSEQKTAIKEARKAMKETMKSKRQEMKASGSRAEFISVNGVNREALIAKSVERATFKANMKADMMEKILAILTDEQKAKFVQALQAEKK